MLYGSVCFWAVFPCHPFARSVRSGLRELFIGGPNGRKWRSCSFAVFFKCSAPLGALHSRGKFRSPFLVSAGSWAAPQALAPHGAVGRFGENGHLPVESPAPECGGGLRRIVLWSCNYRFCP